MNLLESMKIHSFLCRWC